MKTTLNQIREHSPCKHGLAELMSHLGKTKADGEPLSILEVLEWCLRSVKNKDKEIRMYVVWCARQLQHLMTDKRSLDALDVAEKFANGEATVEELEAAREAARAAALATRATTRAATARATRAAARAALAACAAIASEGVAIASEWVALAAQKQKLSEICLQIGEQA